MTMDGLGQLASRPFGLVPRLITQRSDDRVKTGDDLLAAFGREAVVGPQRYENAYADTSRKDS